MVKLICAYQYIPAEGDDTPRCTLDGGVCMEPGNLGCECLINDDEPEI